MDNIKAIDDLWRRFLRWDLEQVYNIHVTVNCA